MDKGIVNFPADADGDALRRLQKSGSDLRKPHDIDFYLIFARKEGAQEAGAAAQQEGFRVQVRQLDDGDGWDCCCTKSMVPTYPAITRTEDDLDAIARSSGGHADGWGTFEVE